MHHQQVFEFTTTWLNGLAQICNLMLYFQCSGMKDYFFDTIKFCYIYLARPAIGKHKVLIAHYYEINFQLINARRQSLFEIQNSFTYRVGNNILSNRLSCLNRLISLNMLNLSFEGFKMKCKSQFLMPPTDV